jgi:hypothetical protein
MNYIAYQASCSDCAWKAKYSSAKQAAKAFDLHLRHHALGKGGEMTIRKLGLDGKPMPYTWTIPKTRPYRRRTPAKPVRETDPGLAFCPCCGANIALISAAIAAAKRVGGTA